MVSTDVQVYRPVFGRILTVIVAVIALLVAVIGMVDNPAQMARYLAPIALLVVATWAAFWRPAVMITPAGVEIRNITRTIELPWPVIQMVDTQYALTLHTAIGQFSAWAAPAPGRVEAKRAAKEGIRHLPSSTYMGDSISPGDLPSSPSGAAALLIRRRWEELRDAGLLDNPKLERSSPRITWHTATLTAMGLLLAVSIAVAVFS